MAEEAANVIGEFDEGFSNRQTWHNAALAAIAIWFEDEELLTRAVQAPTGMLAHLVQGFGEDGMWYEGENYHLFALRGQLTAMGWARQAGVDLLEDERPRRRGWPRRSGRRRSPRCPITRFRPGRTRGSACRSRSRCTWSSGRSGWRAWATSAIRSGAGFAALYAVPAPEAGASIPISTRPDGRRRRARARARSSPGGRCSRWCRVAARDARAVDARDRCCSSGRASPFCATGRRYASLECGRFGGGHGHPDRLHLTLHADGHHWLADPGTGSYVTPDSGWYRSTLAHNAPRLDGRSQPPGDARCDAFEAREGWSWTRGSFGDLTRTLVAGPYLLDVVELNGVEERDAGAAVASRGRGRGGDAGRLGGRSAR